MWKFKKGQAAMEFLMTYGWAILAAIVVIAVLAAFGVFSPSKYVPAACVVNAPWGCEEYSVLGGTTPEIRFGLRNGGGEDLNITFLNVTVKQPTGAKCTANTGNPADSTNFNGVEIVTNGEISTITVTTINCKDISIGNKVSGDILIKYRKIGGTVDRVSTGSITQTAV